MSTSSSTWTAAELLRIEVVDVDGVPLGRVRDLRLTSQGTAVTVTGMMVGSGMLAERLGFAYGAVTSPALLAGWLQRRGHRLHWVPWDQVDLGQVDDGRLRLRVRAADLASVPAARS